MSGVEISRDCQSLSLGWWRMSEWQSVNTSNDDKAVKSFNTLISAISHKRFWFQLKFPVCMISSHLCWEILVVNQLKALSSQTQTIIPWTKMVVTLQEIKQAISWMKNILIMNLKVPSHYLNYRWPSYLTHKCVASPQWVNSLWPSDAIWHWRSWSTLVQVMACCLTAPSHYLNQCWLMISKVLWHSSEDIIIRRFEDTNQ